MDDTVVSYKVLAMGYLRKSPPESKLRYKWKRYWFVLKNIVRKDKVTLLMLEYYKKRDSRASCGRIRIEVGNPNRLASHPSKLLGNEFVFIYASEASTYYFSAANESEKQKWMDQIRRAIKNFSTPDALRKVSSLSLCSHETIHLSVSTSLSDTPKVPPMTIEEPKSKSNIYDWWDYSTLWGHHYESLPSLVEQVKTLPTNLDGSEPDLPMKLNKYDVNMHSGNTTKTQLQRSLTAPDISELTYKYPTRRCKESSCLKQRSFVERSTTLPHNLLSHADIEMIGSQYGSREDCKIEDETETVDGPDEHDWEYLRLLSVSRERTYTNLQETSKKIDRSKLAPRSPRPTSSNSESRFVSNVASNDNNTNNPHYVNLQEANYSNLQWAKDEMEALQRTYSH